jgi:ribA/ribD-fused uncharacterized protein
MVWLIQLFYILKEIVEVSMNPINVYSTDKNGFEKLSNMLNGPVVFNQYSSCMTFPTVEHIYQYCKARFAGDDNAMTKILKAPTGWDAWRESKKIKELDFIQWDDIAYRVLEKCMRLAFEQNEEARDLLLLTNDAMIVHKSPKGFNQGRWEFDFPEILMNIRSYYQNTKEEK